MKRIGHIKDRDGKAVTLIEAMADSGNIQKPTIKRENARDTEKMC